MKNNKIRAIARGTAMGLATMILLTGCARDEVADVWPFSRFMDRTGTVNGARRAPDLNASTQAEVMSKSPMVMDKQAMNVKVEEAQPKMPTEMDMMENPYDYYGGTPAPKPAAAPPLQGKRPAENMPPAPQASYAPQPLMGAPAAAQTGNADMFGGNVAGYQPDDQGMPVRKALPENLAAVQQQSAFAQSVMPPEAPPMAYAPPPPPAPVAQPRPVAPPPPAPRAEPVMPPPPAPMAEPVMPPPPAPVAYAPPPAPPVVQSEDIYPELASVPPTPPAAAELQQNRAQKQANFDDMAATGFEAEVQRQQLQDEPTELTGSPMTPPPVAPEFEPPPPLPPVAQPVVPPMPEYAPLPAMAPAPGTALVQSAPPALPPPMIAEAPMMESPMDMPEAMPVPAPQPRKSIPPQGLMADAPEEVSPPRYAPQAPMAPSVVLTPPSAGPSAHYLPESRYDARRVMSRRSAAF